MSNIKMAMKWSVPLLLFLLLSFDGITHWDETNYLYKGAFSIFDLDAHWVHYSGGFYSGRMFHIFLLNFLFRIFGTGLYSLAAVEFCMALMVAGSALILARIVRREFPESRISYPVFVSFLFLPISLYLSFKSLTETTVIFFSAGALLFYFMSLTADRARSRVYTVLAGVVLFLAANARIESLAVFGSIAIPHLLIVPGPRLRRLTRLAAVGLIWLLLLVIVGGLTGIWCTEFIVRRTTAYSNLSADSADYPPNLISLALSGGAMWFFALFSLLSLRDRVTRLAWVGLIISIVPVLLLVEHNELRYYHTGIFVFALVVALGLRNLADFLKTRLKLRAGVLIAGAIFCLAVLLNQFIRPFYEVGTVGIPLVKMVRRIETDYDDPLVLMAHPHSTYAFTRLCFPDHRIALDRDFEKSAPLMILDADTLAEHKGPIFYITPGGVREKPVLIKLLHRLRGGGGEDERKGGIPRDSWVTGSDALELVEEDRAERYILYSVSFKEGEAATGGVSLE